MANHNFSNSTWEQAGFGGAGNFLGVYFDTTQPGVVYALSDVAGVFRSTDYGDHWEVRSAGLGNYQISSFAIDAFEPNTLYAGTASLSTSRRAGIYVSRDAGLTWQHLESTFTNKITFSAYRTANSIAPDPVNEGVILSGSCFNGIWRSIDRGLNWTQVYESLLTNVPRDKDCDEEEPTGAPYHAPVSVVIFAPSDSNVVYAGLDGAGVIKSTEGGVAGSWQSKNQGLLDEATVKGLAVGSVSVLYAAVGADGVYKSVNGGDTWQSVNTPFESNDEQRVFSVAVHPDNPDIAYLALASYSYANVWKTTDGGATWVAKAPEVPWAEEPEMSGNPITYDLQSNPTRSWATISKPSLSCQVTLEPASPNRIFYVDLWSIKRSDDAGEHWAEKVAGAQNTVLTDLVVDTDHPAGEPDTLYATYMDAGVLKSTDGGTTWTAVLPNMQMAVPGHFWQFAIAKVGDRKYYYTTSDPWAGSLGYVLRSVDGVHWVSVLMLERTKCHWMGSGSMMGLAIDPSQPSTIYAAQCGGKIYKSTDNGDSWAATVGQPEEPIPLTSLTVDNVGRIFAATLWNGLWRSTDGGDSWERVLTYQWTISDVVTAHGTIYASAGDANLHRSTDGGDTWEQLTNYNYEDDGDGEGNRGETIIVDPSDSNHILFSFRNSWQSADASLGIVESTDGGVTWTPLNTGLKHLKVRAMGFGTDGTLYAGTWGSSTWRLTPTTIPTVGDVSGDGKVTALDASLVLQHVVRLIELTPTQQELADVSGDGNISAYDAAVILQYVVEMITQFPVQAAPILAVENEERLLTKIVAELENSSLLPEQRRVLEELKSLLLQRALPKRTALLQNYPNPFNPETWIPFQLSDDAAVTISIYDVDGQIIRKIGVGDMPAGVYADKDRSVYWNGCNDAGEKVSSGVYFYHLQAGDYSATKRMLILK